MEYLSNHSTDLESEMLRIFDDGKLDGSMSRASIFKQENFQRSNWRLDMT